MSRDATPSSPAIETAWNLSTRGDDVYAALIAAHHGLTDDQSRRLNVRLVLLLANHVGEHDVILAAIERARAGVTESG